MIDPGKPANEAQRLALLERYRLFIDSSEPEFDRIARTAADIFDMPIALVSLVLTEEQGFIGAGGLGVGGTARDIAFCSHAIFGEEVFVVPDAHEDPRFSRNPLVTGPPGIRFYAGAPLVLEPGLAVGTLCLIDHVPRQLDAKERRRLKDLAGTVVDMVRLRVGALLSDHARSEAHAARRRLEDVFDAVPAEVAFYGRDGRLERSNRRFAEHFCKGEPPVKAGMTLDEVHETVRAQGHTLLDGPSSGMDEEGRRLREMHLADGRRLRTIEMPTRDGETITVDVDVTDIRQSEEALAAGSLLMSTTIQGIEHGVLVLDADLRVEMVNDAYPKILNLPLETCQRDRPVDGIMRALAARGLLGEGSAESIVAERRASLERGESRRERLILENDRAAEVWRRAMPDGRFLLVVTDITAHHRVERMKNEFISTVSHELRTPLTSIAGALGLLEGGAGGETSEKGRRLLGIARANSKRLERIINDLLDIGRLESGRLELDPKEVDLREAIFQAVEANGPYAEKFGVTIETQVQDTARIEADPHRLHQVLTNLLSNAVKFSPSGSAVTLALAVEDGRAEISVADLGPGISEEFRDRIFGKFAQADSSDRRSRDGAGLGLSISRSLVEAMHGAIDFTTEQGQGTTFRVTFLLEREIEQPTARAALSAIPKPSFVVLGRGGAEQALGEALTRRGAKVDFAADLTEAEESLRSPLEAGSACAIIILPSTLEAQGETLVRRIHASELLAAVPVIALPAPPENGAGFGSGRDAALGAVLSAVSPAPSIRRPEILHVEDDDDLRSVAEPVLAPLGKLTTARDLATARALLADRVFDVVILDIGLPDGSGLDLLPLLERGQSRVPVVVFSGADLPHKTRERVAAALTKSRDSVLHMAETVRRILTDDGRGAEADGGEA